MNNKKQLPYKPPPRQLSNRDRLDVRVSTCAHTHACAKQFSFFTVHSFFYAAVAVCTGYKQIFKAYVPRCIKEFYEKTQ